MKENEITNSVFAPLCMLTLFFHTAISIGPDSGPSGQIHILQTLVPITMAGGYNIMIPSHLPNHLARKMCYGPKGR